MHTPVPLIVVPTVDQQCAVIRVASDHDPSRRCPSREAEGQSIATRWLEVLGGLVKEKMNEYSMANRQKENDQENHRQETEDVSDAGS
jgi:hypothetical protein